MVLLTGDTHGHFDRIEKISNPEETTLIILGDAGINYYLDNREQKKKEKLNKTLHRLYLVRGNHELRPEDIDSMQIAYDEEIHGEVYYQPEYPNIRYLMDGGEYIINGLSTLVIGGAYSVDKWFRLDRGWTWFPNEQLSLAEMGEINKKICGKSYNVILSHTCPYSWQPFDLFLSEVNQDTVDKSMEYWLESVKENLDFDYWFFGHFHGDRMIDEGVYMLYESFREFPEKTME